MTWPEIESPAFAGQGDDYFDAAITHSIYDDQTSIATAVENTATRKCRSCAAFFQSDAGRGECHRYAPKPNYDHTLSVEWPRVTSADFCLEFVSRGGDL